LISVHARLDASRRELLDLGLRNPLLNYRLLRTRGLEITGTSPETLFRLLVEEGRKMAFVPRVDQAEEIEANEITLANTSPKSRRRESRLQTKHPAEELQRRLLSTYRLASSFEQEQGVNTLFLALGMLRWFESDSSELERRSPLVLVPVRLDRSDVRDRFRIGYTGEDIGANLSLIEKLRVDHGVTLPNLQEEEDLDLSQYFASAASTVDGISRWEVDQESIVVGFFSFNKFLMYQDLSGDNWPDNAKPSDHPIIEALFGGGFNEPDTVFHDDTDMDQHVDPAGQHLVLDADSSQVAAIADVASGRNLVVQGPPGTGKSQTIANLIGEAIGLGKTVLFVSEKMAALEVVKRRLDSVDLGDACLDLHRQGATKRVVLTELERTLKLGRPVHETGTTSASRLKRLRDILNGYSYAVNAPIGKTGESPHDLFGHLDLLRRRIKGQELMGLGLEGVDSWSPAEFQRKRDVVQEVQTRLLSVGVPSQHVFWGTQLKVFLPSAQDALRRRLSESIDALDSLEHLAQEFARLMRVGSPSDHKGLQRLLCTAEAVGAAPDVTGIGFNLFLEEKTAVDELLQAGLEHEGLHREFDRQLTPDAWSQDLSSTAATIANSNSTVLRFLSSDYRAAIKQLKSICISVPRERHRQLEMIDAVARAETARQTVQRLAGVGLSAFGPFWSGMNSDWGRLERIFQWVIQAVDQEERNIIEPGTSRLVSEEEPPRDIGTRAAEVEKADVAYSAFAIEVQETLKLDLSKRFESDRGLLDLPYNRQRQTLTAWNDRTSDINDILTYNSIVDLCHDEGLESMLDVVESWSEAGTRLVDAFDQERFESLIQRTLGERDVLSTFDSAAHENTIEEFRNADRLSFSVNKAKLAYAHYSGVPRHDGSGQLAVLNREFQKKRRHLPIRRLMAEAGNAIQSIKPVLMMSPLSIARFLPPSSVHFDLVIFDEASQVRPVDALGAILRGQQAVVVGDSKQLPPTRFFESATESDDEEEDNVTTDMESILGLFLSQNAPDRMLRWHYRSQHESLIAVSNREFYRNQLVVFPSPDSERRDVGLRYHLLPDTVYDRGRSATNPEEALAVAQAVITHARETPSLTLGVASFSSAQMQAVLDRLETLRQQSPETEDFFVRHANEPFFVKNLENVQGDERDVIFISVGYGKNANGRVAMNFGPLTSDGGERRLNVLITRARRKCEVFTNLTADDLTVDNSTSEGNRKFKVFLSYAERGELEFPEESSREIYSPFQDSVAAELVDLGYEVRKEVGSGGYFIDIAVVDPLQPGRFLVGIECDGASYHSARSARDRDRLRDQVLKNLNWTIHHVWSTDWFKHKGRELERVIQVIENAKGSRTAPAPIFFEDSNSIARETSPARQTEDKVPKYVVSRPVINLGRLELHEVPAPKIAGYISEVVEVESPVPLSEVYRRIANGAGVSRVGARIKATIDSGIRHASRKKLITKRGEFLWSTYTRRPGLRDRSSAPARLRAIDLISNEEVSQAVEEVVKRSFGIGETDVASPVATLLGFQRVSEDFQARVRSAVKGLLKDKTLILTNDQLRLP
jgi:very-short-patch-repair endonuclease